MDGLDPPSPPSSEPAQNEKGMVIPDQIQGVILPKNVRFSSQPKTDAEITVLALQHTQELGMPLEAEGRENDVRHPTCTRFDVKQWDVDKALKTNNILRKSRDCWP
ncbi:hypothetical protein IMZ48_35785 [Candidatus Bathyarchaeota archaeon]|nr:hypothetical protein [Candidatus Bathyarchaeota archaeon]